MPTLNQYTKPDANVTVASGLEALLIKAESQLAAGDAPGFIATLNAARATNATLAASPLIDPGTPAGRVDLLFRERGFWLYLTGHRLGDLRRYNLPPMPIAGAPYVNGGVYATQSCFPLPDVERINNPTIAKGA